ncbi:MAG: CoA transferase [Hungatella sp.]|jgi:crotonobetainyl-CoA:carnitine CoA-transferase CaiB-like acyl-CoA transferase|nr:CoA transferase [Hungatella sp.]
MGPLNGIKILGFTHFAQAPFALQTLGDLGADVINIERPGSGDFNRSQYKEACLNGESPFFLAMNRNKRSMTLDMKQEKAKDVVRDLIRNTDVIVSNFRPGVLDKLGFGYEEAKKLNPRIIYAHAVGYGRKGPYEKLPGQDLMAQCLSGYAYLVGKDGPPQTGGTFLADMYSAGMLTVGILAALVSRDRGGQSQEVEVSLLNSALHLQCQELTHYMNTGRKPERPKNFSGQVQSWAPYGIYATKDGYLCLSVVDKDKVGDLGHVLGIENLESIMPDKEVMFRDRDKIYDVLQEALSKKETDHWIGRLQKAGIWCGRVNDYDQVVKDPQVIYNEMIRTISHPVAGQIKVVNCPIGFSKTPAEIRMAPPLLGEHNEEILRELGYSDEKINELKGEGIF